MKQKFTERTHLCIMALLICFCSFGQTTNVWTGSQGTSWNTPGNWSLNTIPTLSTNVQIPVVTSAAYPVLNGLDGTADCRNITIDNGIQLLLSDYGSLRVAGTLSGPGHIKAEGGTLVLGGTQPQTLNAAIFTNNTVSSLNIYNTTSVTLSGSLNLTGILSLESGVFETAGGLTLKSDEYHTAQVAESIGSITGNVTVERYIPARRAFRLLSAPTTGGTIYSNWQEGAPATDPVGYGTDITGAGGTANGFDASGSNNPSLFMHNNATATWVAATTTATALNAGDPYRLLVRGDRTVNQASNSAPATATTLRSTGALTVGTVAQYNLNTAAGGFSFVGNPYQASVNMEDVLNDASTLNLNENFYYVWDPTLNTRGAYVTVIVDSNSNTNPSSDANKYLQPNQAFFVQTQSAGQAGITFKEEHKYTSGGTATPNLYRTTTDAATASISLSLHTDESLATNGAAADGVIVRLAEGFSNDIDAFDAVKPVNQDENMGVVNNGTVLSFESRAMPLAGETLTISNTAYRTTAYTYKAAVSNLEGVTPFLHDSFMGTMTPLQNNTETLYSFTVIADEPASNGEGRFEIVFQTTASAPELQVSQKAVVYPNPSAGTSFNVMVPGNEAATVNIYNQLGQRVGNTTTAQDGTLAVQPQTPLATGIYMIEVNAGNKVYTQKLIVKN